MTLTSRELLADEMRRKVATFFRNDDVGELSDNLIRLTELFVSHRLPVCHQVVPVRLTAKTIEYFKTERIGDYVEIGQHGYAHIDYIENGEHSGEFGSNRSYETKLSEIIKGRKILEDDFGTQFAPVFTPPWNAMDDGTIQILIDNGYKAYSSQWSLCKRSFQGKILYIIYNFYHKYKLKRDKNKKGILDLSVCIDFVKNWNTKKHKTLDEMISDYNLAKKLYKNIGIMIHHELLNNEDFITLDGFLHFLNQNGGTILTINELYKKLEVGNDEDKFWHNRSERRAFY